MSKLLFLSLGSTAVIGGGIGTGIYFGVGYGNRSPNEEEKGEKPRTDLEHQTVQAPSLPDTGSNKWSLQEIP